MKYIIEKIKPHKALFIFGVMFLAIEASCDLLLPSIMSRIVDKGIAGSNMETIVKSAIFMFCIALTGACCAVCRNRFSAQLSENVGRDIRNELFEKVERFSFASFGHFKAGSLITRLTNDITQITGFVFGLLRILIKAPIMALGAMSLIVINTPEFAPVLFLIIVLASIWTVLNVYIGYPRYNVVQDKLDAFNAKIREFLLGIRLVKAYSAEKDEVEESAELSDELRKANIRALRVSAVFMPLVHFSVNLGILIILILSNIERKNEVGALMATINYMTQLSISLSQVSNIVNRSVRAGTSANRIKAVLDYKDDGQNTSGNTKIDNITSIEMNGVSFIYPESKEYTLQDVSLSVQKGEVLSIIGPTGSGKTTLINLLPRFFDISSGTYSINGQDNFSYDIEDLRKSFAVISQNPFLFSGTIRDNLLFSNEKATDEEIIDALKKAEAYGFVSSLPDGLDTILGQGGVNLSGGQKQRLSIARAIVSGASFFIVDDATSALDSFTEHRVLDNLFNLDSTFILVTQRISTARRADRILVLDNGRSVGLGKHAELIKRCEIYKEIYNSQIGGDL